MAAGGYAVRQPKRTQPCGRCGQTVRSRLLAPVCRTCQPRGVSANRSRPTVPCGRCGKAMRSQAAIPRCADCVPPWRPLSDAEANRTPAYCELCGRVHAGRWECRERAEKSGEAVRLFLLERGEL